MSELAPAYELNAMPVSPEVFYAAACNPHQHVAIEACAGAGKTWILVSRIIRALLEGAKPQEILAITFTKKAAGEMRERLLDWLQKFSSQSDLELELELTSRGVLQDQVKHLAPKLAGLYADILAGGQPVQIRTFHSWFAALLKGCPLSVLQNFKLPISYALLEDDAPARAQVWRPFYTRLHQDPNALADYQYLVGLHGRSQTEKALESGLQKRVEFQLAEAAGVVKTSVSKFDEMFPQFQKLVSPAQSLCQVESRQRWLQWSAELGRETLSTPRKAAAGIVAAFELLAQPDGASDATSEATWEQALETLKKALFVSKEERLNHHLKAYPAAQAAELELQALSQAQDQYRAYLHQQAMRRLMLVLVQEYSSLKLQQGWVDMNDVELLANALMSDPVLSGWVQERLDQHIRHVLIDEFQDTSPLQWQTLHAWVSSYVGAGGGTRPPSLFIVGDPKQSIYRFRRAEPQVFKAAQTFIRQELSGDLLSCDHTRRNALQVTDAVNRMMKSESQRLLSTHFRWHTTASHVSGEIYKLPLVSKLQPSDAGMEFKATTWRDSLTNPRSLEEDTLKVQECKQMAHHIASLLDQQRYKPHDLMVLSRKRDNLVLMEQALRALGIPADQPEKLELASAPEVLDVLALLDALVSTQHDLSLAQALKSPLFGVSDADLMELSKFHRLLATESGDPVGNEAEQIPGKQAPLAWFDVLQHPSLQSERLRVCGQTLLKWKAFLAQLPPHDALSQIYQEGDVIGKFVAACPRTLRYSVQANLQALLWAALSLDRGRYASPYAFIRALKAEGAYQTPRAQTPDDAVKLLTVHGAKGLEAPCVFLLDTHSAPQNAQSMSVLINWPGQSKRPTHFIFMRSEARVTPSVRGLMEEELQARALEERNALYVAMTRAQECLVVSASEPHRINDQSWWQCFVSYLPEMSERAMTPVMSLQTQVTEGDMTPEVFILRTLPVLKSAASSDKQVAAEVLIDDETTSPQWASRDRASRIGQAMHRLLEWQGLDGLNIAQEHIQKVQRQFKLDASSLYEAVQSAAMILKGEATWAWQSQYVTWWANELPVTFKGQTFRLDRLVKRRISITQEEWWVLDYKLSHQPLNQEALTSKMKLYVQAAQIAIAQLDEVGRSLKQNAAVNAAFLSASGECIMLTAKTN
ncbi:MAG: DNA helicase UvrD [Betaproteobacteria bacterium]|nr:DNA helicase UvrD [Betaproteobacteria bacterium]NBY72539.1 DNA helicase UvrD [Betaproteobacteria bacterium]